jgi:hypothetical protein
MEYLIGLLLALGVAALAALSGMDRHRSFYPAVAIVVASYYVLFAAMSTSTGAAALSLESAVGVAFTVLAVYGFKRNMWLVAAAIAGHGLFDMIHHLLIENPGVPVWWPGFCGTVDVILGAWLGFRLWTGTQDDLLLKKRT